MLNKLLMSSLVRVTGNDLAQQLLRRNVFLSQFLMGIGTGGAASASGERAIFDLLLRRHRAPYCIFDVGANKGQFLQLALAHMGQHDFTVHCFEPGQASFAALSAHRDPRAVLNNVGLGRKPGELTLHYDEPGSMLASLTKRKLEHFGIYFGQAEQVPIETLDDYCASRAIRRISLLKVDVEGHELDVFSGASKLFAARAIDIVTFEFGGCNLDTRTSFRDFWYFFAELGMRIARITPSGYLSPLHSYQELDEQYRTTNFVALAGDTPP